MPKRFSQADLSFGFWSLTFTLLDKRPIISGILISSSYYQNMLAGFAGILSNRVNLTFACPVKCGAYLTGELWHLKLNIQYLIAAAPF